LKDTFNTNRLYLVFYKYVAVKKSEINEKVDNVRVGNTYDKLLQ